MAKAPTAAPATPEAPAQPALTAQEEWILTHMLGDDFKAAILDARARTGDASIMINIGANPAGEGEPYPSDFIPGLASIHRGGHDTVFGLSHDEALAQLAALA